MSSQNDDFEDETEAAIDELSQHGKALHQLIQGYMDEHDLSDETTSLILLEMSVRMHMVGYALDNLIRDAKKNAHDFIAEAKTVRAAAETEGKLDDERGVP